MQKTDPIRVKNKGATATMYQKIGWHRSGNKDIQAIIIAIFTSKDKY